MDKCKHGFNSACLICGFSQIEGNKVWFDWAFQHQQAKVEVLERRNQMLSDSVKEMGEKCIRDADLINQQATMLGELQKRVDKAVEAINEHYESDGMSGLYFMDLKEILEGEQALKGEG